MKSLFLAWQAPTEAPKSRAWFPVGRLDADLEKPSYRFRYTQGALTAKQDVGFSPLLAFPDFQKDYRSGELFPLFRNRVISPNRRDFDEYIAWLDLDRNRADPIEILAVSGGQRATDNLEVFPKIITDQSGDFRLRFFLHGTRYINPLAMERLGKLKVGERLQICVELNNPATRLAVTLLTEDYVVIGWAPRYLVEDLIKCIPNSPDLCASVGHINSADAPANQRVLVDFSGRAPEGNQPMSTPDFKPLID
jgi:hypothetical protein